MFVAYEGVPRTRTGNLDDVMPDDPEQLRAFMRGETDDPGLVRAVRGGLRYPEVPADGAGGWCAPSAVTCICGSTEWPHTCTMPAEGWDSPLYMPEVTRRAILDEIQREAQTAREVFGLPPEWPDARCNRCGRVMPVEEGRAHALADDCQPAEMDGG